MTLYAGLQWLVNRSATQQLSTELQHAVTYAEAKLGAPVRLIACPLAESYPNDWDGIPIRPDKRILAHHIYLVTEVARDQEIEDEDA